MENEPLPSAREIGCGLYVALVVSHRQQHHLNDSHVPKYLTPTILLALQIVGLAAIPFHDSCISPSPSLPVSVQDRDSLQQSVPGTSIIIAPNSATCLEAWKALAR